MNEIRVGVIGCGYWGPNLIRNFVENPNAKLVAVADLDDERLAAMKARYPQIQTTKDFHDLFTMHLDAIVVATPPATHYRIGRECLENDLHVLIEKPITTNSLDAMHLIQLSEQKDKVLMVGHTFEYNSAVHSLKEIIQRGDVGKVLYIDAARLSLGLFQRDVDVIWDLAPHDISILLFLLGREPISVCAQGMRCAFSDIYDNVYMILTFPEHILAHVHVSWLDPCKVRRVTVVGSKKMVVFNDVESNEKIRIYDKSVEIPDYTEGLREFHCNYHSGDILIPKLRFEEPLKKECQHFLDCISEHQLPCSNGYDGLKVIKIIEAAEHSLMSGMGEEGIQWPEQIMFASHQMSNSAMG